MKNIKLTSLFFLTILALLLSPKLFAITQSEAFASCSALKSSLTYPNPPYTSFEQYYGPLACIQGINNTVILDIPSGGLRYGTYPYNDPCTTNFNWTTGNCPASAQCDPPETDNGFGICEVTECTLSQVLNPTTGACQTPPTCGITEKYDPTTNTCFLKTLQCPGHTHASTANDRCLPDPPNACPLGKHDNGNYECVADDAKGCSKTQQAGYINGQLQCINKPNLDTAQQAAADAAKGSTTAADNLKTASAAQKLATDALAEDPTNTILIKTATLANNAVADAKNKLDAEKTKASADDTEAKNGLLNSIDQTLKAQNEGTPLVFTPGTSSTFDDAQVQTAIEEAKTEYQTEFDSIKSQIGSIFTFSHSGSGSLPTFDFGTYYGVHVVSDLNRFSIQLGYVSLTIMFLAAYISVRILLD